MNQLVVCPVCGSDLVKDTRKVQFNYKGHSIELEQSGQFCQSCGEGFLTPKESKSNDLALKSFHNEFDGLLTPGQIRSIRKRLHLSQIEAGQIFGGGPVAFSKYERGEISHSRALDIILRLLDKRQISLDAIKAIEAEALAN